jgi:hypothetical protein
MNHEKQAREPGTSAQPDPSGSIFQVTIQGLAKRRGTSVQDALASERDAALAPGGMGDDCLLPDEVDDLLTSPNLQYSDGRLTSRPGRSLTAAESEAMDHVATCRFCLSLIRIAQPQVSEREEFLAHVRAEAKTAHGSNVGSCVPAPIMGLAPAGMPRRAYWPLVLPLALLLGATAAAQYKATVFSEAYFHAWPWVLLAGLFGAVVGGFGSQAPEKLGLRRRHHISRRFGSTAPVIGISLGALVAMSVLGGTDTYRTDKAVQSAQTEAIQSAVAVLSRTRASANPVVLTAEFKPCAAPPRSTATSTLERYCSAVDGAPGDVVVELSPQKADVYWEVRGRKVRQIELALAKIKKQPDGSVRVALHTGSETAVSPKSEGEYKDGESVIAIPRSPAIHSLAQSLPSLDEKAGQFALIRASLDSK